MIKIKEASISMISVINNLFANLQSDKTMTLKMGLKSDAVVLSDEPLTHRIIFGMYKNSIIAVTVEHYNCYQQLDIIDDFELTITDIASINNTIIETFNL